MQVARERELRGLFNIHVEKKELRGNATKTRLEGTRGPNNGGNTYNDQ